VAGCVQQLLITAALSTPAVPGAFGHGPVCALTSTAPLIAAPAVSALPNPAAFTRPNPSAIREAMAQSKAWHQAMVLSKAWQQLQSLQQPSIRMLAQEIPTLAPPAPALLSPQCTATVAQPVLVSLDNMAAPFVAAQPFAETLLTAMACSMAWQTKPQRAPQCSLPQPSLLMPAPAARPKSDLIEMLENSRLWQQKQRQQQPAPSQPQLPAVPCATAQALRDAISCSKRWLRQQRQVAQIRHQVQHPCRQLTFSAFGPETHLQAPTTLLLGSLLDESQASGNQPQTGVTSRPDRLTMSQVATQYSVRPDGSNSGHITAVAAVGGGGCHMMAPSAATLDVQAAAPKDEEREEKTSDLEKDQQVKDHHGWRGQSEVVKGGCDKTKKECHAKWQGWANKSKGHWQGKRWGSRARGSKGKHQGHCLQGKTAGSQTGQEQGGGPLTAFAVTQGAPCGADPAKVAAPATYAALARKRDREAKDPASGGLVANATRKCKHAAAVSEVKSITRISPDEMETQPADINETWFASLMEPTLCYASVEHPPNLLDTATTLEFPGVAMQQHDRLQTAPTLLYTNVASREQPLNASVTPTLDPEPSAAALSLDAKAPDLQVVAMLSSIVAEPGTATSLIGAADGVTPGAVAAAAPQPLATLAPTTSDAAAAAGAPDA